MREKLGITEAQFTEIRLSLHEDLLPLRKVIQEFRDKFQKTFDEICTNVPFADRTEALRALRGTIAGEGGLSIELGNYSFENIEWFLGVAEKILIKTRELLGIDIDFPEAHTLLTDIVYFLGIQEVSRLNRKTENMIDSIYQAEKEKHDQRTELISLQTRFSQQLMFTKIKRSGVVGKIMANSIKSFIENSQIISHSGCLMKESGARVASDNSRVLNEIKTTNALVSEMNSTIGDFVEELVPAE